LPEPQTPPSGTAENRRIRLRTARFSLGSAIALCALKFVVGLVSGSLGVLSSAVDNLADILMSGVNFLSIRKAMDPADANHPYGHGKIETLGTLFQGVTVGGIGCWIVLEGVRRLREGATIGMVDLSLVVMAASAVASWFIAERIRKAGVATGSPALAADSVHFRTDVWSGGGVFASLLLIRLTGLQWIDAAVGFAVGIYIVGAAGRLLWDAAHDLADRGLPPETVEEIARIIEAHRPMVVDWHDLRTRRSGSEKHVDFHVVVCKEHSLEDAHRVADHLEHEIREALGHAHVVTHIDPCDLECPGVHECARVKGMIRTLSSPERDADGDRGPEARGEETVN
jgi:cation diffusion facilitator family transporter